MSTDRAGAIEFLRTFTAQEGRTVEALIRRGNVIRQVDPATCDWPDCRGWHMEPDWHEGIPVAELADEL